MQTSARFIVLIFNTFVFVFMILVCCVNTSLQVTAKFSCFTLFLFHIYIYVCVWLYVQLWFWVCASACIVGSFFGQVIAHVAMHLLFHGLGAGRRREGWREEWENSLLPSIKFLVTQAPPLAKFMTRLHVAQRIKTCKHVYEIHAHVSERNMMRVTVITTKMSAKLFN